MYNEKMMVKMSKDRTKKRYDYVQYGIGREIILQA